MGLIAETDPSMGAEGSEDSSTYLGPDHKECGGHVSLYGMFPGLKAQEPGAQGGKGSRGPSMELVALETSEPRRVKMKQLGATEISQNSSNH